MYQSHDPNESCNCGKVLDILTGEMVVRKLEMLRNGLLGSLREKEKKRNIRKFGIVSLLYILCNFS